MMDQITILLVLLVGGIIQGATGFGFSIFTMSILPIILPFKTASLTVLCASLVMILSLGVRLHSKINFKLVIWPIIGSIVGRFMGVSILTFARDDTLTKLLALFLVSFTIYFIFFVDKIKLPANRLSGTTAGLLSGIFAGVANVGGPPLVAFFYSTTGDKEEYMATTQVAFLAGGIVSLLINILYGNITQEIITYSFFGTGGVLAGSYIGVKIFNCMNQGVLSRVINFYIAVMALLLLIK